MGNPDQNAAAYKRWRIRLRAQIDEFKTKPCKDCGKDYHPFVMDFDHRPGEVKEFNISSAITQGFGWERIAAEAAKCDLVCSNCHRMRTLARKPRATPEPVQRATHCPKAHEYSAENTRVRMRRGRFVSRECLICTRAADCERGKRKRREQAARLAMYPGAVPVVDKLLGR